MQHFIFFSCHITTSFIKTVFMVRYFMSFDVPKENQRSVQKIIDRYFEELDKHGPGGMRSQCYADYNDECRYVHIKSFKRESVANQHFKSGTFRKYINDLAALCGSLPAFA